MDWFKKFKKPGLPAPVIPARQPVEWVEADPEQGLTQMQVQQRKSSGWHNKPSRGVLLTDRQIIAQHCLTFFNLVFLVLAVVLAIAGSSIKNMTFMIVMIINTVIGIVQEIRAKRAVEKLTLVAARPVRTVRDGGIRHILSEELVRDDIVIFGPGDQICADGVVCAGQLQVNESLVTGEADAIVRQVGEELKSGSFVVAGQARVRLTRVGDDAFAARLSLEAKKDPKAGKSEMMRSLDKLIRVVGFALIPVGIVLFYQEFVTLKLDLTASAEATVAALVGMIPEGLYLLTSIALAASAIKLSRQRVLVQDMNCIETLARVDVLCVDKTGTITEPKMEVENVLPLTQAPPEELEAVLTAIYGSGEPENDTAAALKEMFSGKSSWKRKYHIPFTSQTKWSASVFEEQGAYLVGAPETIMGSLYETLRPEVEPWQSTGYRVLLVAGYAGEPSEKGLEPAQVRPLALVLLSNRIRPEALQTFRYFAEQGVCIKVISGDNPATAADVARRAGIAEADAWVDATTLETEEDYTRAVQSYTVFGRVTPDQKKKLVSALKKLGHTVAMTGDGVNDVLAMREANCAVAMAGGAQAASQIAQLVLLDSDFSAMPGIVAEGRRVVNNIQRAATLFLVKNIFSLGLALTTLLIGLPYPIVPIHLTVISALTIGVPSFFLAMEPNYARFQGHFLRGVLRRAFPGGLTNIFVVLAAQAYMAVFGLTLAQTGTVCAAILGVVGLLVLYQVSKPFDKFRAIIWWLMAAALLVCFTALGSLFNLHLGDWTTVLVTVTLLIMAPTVFLTVTRIFDWGDKVVERLRKWKEKRHADL